MFLKKGYTPENWRMTMENSNHEWVDVSPIKHCVFPASHVSFQGSNAASALLIFHREVFHPRSQTWKSSTKADTNIKTVESQKEEKKNKLLLLIKYWLFNMDPDNGSL